MRAKHPKHAIKRFLLVVILVALSCSPIVLFCFTAQNFVLSATAPPISKNLVALPKKIEQAISSQKQIISGLPVRLKIPKIKLDAVIESVGLTANRAVGVPKKQEDVAWYNLGPRPGEIGNAIITGHYGWQKRKPSVFDNLYKLRPGDKLYLVDDQGVTTTFVMRTSRRYNPTDDATGVFNSSDGKAHLNLITCEGLWNKFSKSYSLRLVVFFDKE